MKRDICYTVDTSDVVEVPFTITGSCDGRQALATKVINLMFTSEDGFLRYEGAGLYDALSNANMVTGNELAVQNLVNIYTERAERLVKKYQEQQPALSAEEKLFDVQLDNLAITDAESLYFDVVIITENGETQTANITLEI